MEKLAKNKEVFLALSGIGLCSLIAAFGNPLEKLEVYRQYEVGSMGISYEKTFIITESTRNLPYGFDKVRAKKIAQVYQDYKVQKWSFVMLAIACSTYAMYLGKQTVPYVEIDAEVSKVKEQGKKEVILEGVKHRLAMASKSQRLMFIDEMRELIEEFGSLEQETMKIDTTLATDKFINASFLLGEGHSVDVVVSQTWQLEVGTPEHKEMKAKFLAWQSGDDEESVVSTLSKPNFRDKFPESMDNIYLSAVTDALSRGVLREVVITDVLKCDDLELGELYLQHLKV